MRTSNTPLIRIVYLSFVYCLHTASEHKNKIIIPRFLRRFGRFERWSLCVAKSMTNETVYTEGVYHTCLTNRADYFDKVQSRRVEE